ncbi:2TM domain-containing protein [Marivita hallyeonensis]|uniref:2TM domain-containing protein n=1 Tax=Marivita hallyeonensis TaxID=996342 RepID=A0A1M5M6P0_9RHOB|nr:2TM domain-containing protein [Marivita hallyeonensis]SHG72918.1 2TM domain-containing protein [Marivita hallyeonensis]
MTHADSYEKARGRAEAKFGFYVHAFIFAAVIGVLVIINLVTSPEINWTIWPMLGWGLAVALHGARVFFAGDKEKIIDALTEEELRQSDGKPRDSGTS